MKIATLLLSLFLLNTVHAQVGPTVVSLAAESITSSSANIRLKLSKAANFQLRYGPTLDYGTMSALIGTLKAEHVMSLTGLKPSTLYHYQIRSVDSENKEVISVDKVFTTAAAVVAAPTVVSLAAESITTTSANIRLKLSQPANFQVRYGPTLDYGTMPALIGTLKSEHVFSIAGLKPSTLYHYQIRSVDANNKEVISVDKVFTTAAVVAPPVDVGPTVVSLAAESITSSSVNVRLKLSKPANAQLQYGTTLTYGTIMPMIGSLQAEHVMPLTGLKAGTLYHYQIRSVDANNKEILSADKVFTTLAAPVVPVPASNKAIGYANVNGLTTGGEGGRTVTVSTINDLKSAASSSEKLIIQVSGAIVGNGLINVSSNKTILGLKGSSLTGGSLFMYGTSNIIIKNMTIREVPLYSNIIIKEGAHHIWVDHCDLSSKLTSSWEYYDGLLDVGNQADYVTLSWNVLHDNHIPMLIGFGYSVPADIGKLHVTVHNNYFYNVTERQPDVRYGSVHVFNNYFTSGSYAVAATMGANVRTDNNHFENINSPIRTTFTYPTGIQPTPGFITGANTNIFSGSGANIITSAAANWDPGYEFRSVLIPAANVRATVMDKAGPE